MTRAPGSGPRRNDLPRTIQDHFGGGHSPIAGGILAEYIVMLAAGTLTKDKRHRLLRKMGAENSPEYRKAEIDLVLSYFRAAVEAQNFGAEQRKDFATLKDVFEIAEGEFAKYRPVELARILNAEVEKILDDDVIDPKEDEYQVALQDALDLGYDEYMVYCRRAFEHEALRLEEALASARDAQSQIQLQRKIDQLLPLIRLAQMQKRTPGALY